MVAAPTGAQAGGGSRNALDASLRDPKVIAIRDRWYANRIKAGHSHPPFPEIPGWRRMAERQSRERKEEEARRGGAAAKAERKASRGRYRDLGRRDAMELARAKFKGLFSRADRRALPLKESQKIERYPSKTTAVVDDPESGRSLVHSTTPLRARDERGELRPVDLDLVADGSTWTPRNSAAPVEIGSRPGRAMTLPGGLSLGFAPGAGDGQRVSNEIFFTDVARDTDAWFSPTESGGRFALQLRSADSPEEIRLQVGLPDGVTLRTMPDQKAVQAVKDGKRVALITAPFAMDAEEETVPVTMRADGRDLVIAVAHRELDVLYPIAVDPSVYENQEYFGWGNFKGCPDKAQLEDDWCYYETVQKFPHELGDIGWGWGFGYYLHMRDDWFANGDFAEWQYWAPTDWSYIHRIDYMGARHSAWNSATTTGIWSRTQGYFLDFDRLDWSFNNAGNYWTECVDARWDGKNTYGACNDHTWHTEEARGNYAQISISPTRDGWIYYYPTVFLAGARVWLSDFEAPFLTYWYHPGNQDQWVRDTPAGPHNGPNETHVRIDDRGLGMWGLWADVPGKSRQYSTDWGNCSGTYSSPCRPSRAHNFSLVGMNEGTQTVTVAGQDILGQTQTWTKRYKVDRTNPTVAFSGDLAGRDGQALTGSSYPLTIDARDPVPSGANGSSGVQRIELRVDGGKRATWTNPDGADGASQSQGWTLDLNDPYYREGAHTIKVTAFDRAGNESSRTLRFVKDRDVPVLTGVRHEPTPFPTGWIDDETLAVTATGHDFGAGVKHGRVVAPAAAGGDVTVSDSRTCAGSVFSRCPHRRNLLENANWSWEWETANPWRSGNGQMGHWYVGPLVHGGVHFSGRRWPGSGDGFIWYDSARQPVVPGRTYSGHHYARPERSDVARGDFRSEIVFWDTNGNWVGQEYGPLAYEEAGPAWKRSAGVRAVAPPSAASASLRMAWNVRDGFEQWHNADAAHLEEEVDVSQRVVYDTGPLAEGVLSGDRSPRAFLEDAVGRASRAERWTLKVDHSAPETLTLSGPLKDREGQQLATGTYNLTADAKDGIAGDPLRERSGMRNIEFRVDGEAQDIRSQPCDAGSCGMNQTWTFDTRRYRGGEHEIEVIAVDQLGHSTSRSFTVSTPCCIVDPRTWGSAPVSSDMLLGDANGDANADLVLRDKITGEVRVGLSTGTAFGTATSWGIFPQTATLQIGDVNGDARDDLVGRDLVGTLLVARSTGTSFETAQPRGSLDLKEDLVLGDVDGMDGVDLIGWHQDTGELRARFAREGGDGFDPPELIGSWARNRDLRFLDVDQDSLADAVGRDKDTREVLVSLSNEVNLAPSTFWGTVPEGREEAYADLDADQAGDMFTRDTETGELYVSRSGGSAFLAPERWGNWPKALAGESALLLADVNADEEADVVARDLVTGEVRVALTGAQPAAGDASPDYDVAADLVYDDNDEFPSTETVTRSTTTATAASHGSSKRRPVFLAGQDQEVLFGAQDSRLPIVYDRYKQAGVSIVRFNAYWGTHENADPAQAGRKYNFDHLDKAVAAARSRGFTVWITITGVADKKTVNECRKDDKGQPLINRDAGGQRACVSGNTGRNPDAADFADFVSAVVKQYTDPTYQVRHFSIWNEPNLRGWLRGPKTKKRGDAASAALKYRELYQDGYKAAKGVCTCAKVYLGELSELARGTMSAMQFLDEVVPPKSATPLRANGLAIHPYQHRKKPDDKEFSGKKRVPLYGIGRLKEVNDKMDDLKRSGRWESPSGGRPALHLTEFGYWNRPAFTRLGRDTYYTDTARAGRMRDAIRKASRNRATSLLFYQATEKTPENESTCPAPDFFYPKPDWDMGLFGPNGEYTGTQTRCYGKGAKGPSINHPQPRLAYCAIWRWAKDHRRHYPTVDTKLGCPP